MSLKLVERHEFVADVGGDFLAARVFVQGGLFVHRVELFVVVGADLVGLGDQLRVRESLVGGVIAAAGSKSERKNDRESRGNGKRLLHKGLSMGGRTEPDR